MGKSRSGSSLEVIQSCLSCPVREESLFCNLAPQALQELNAMRRPVLHPSRAVLFVEGQLPEGIFVLCSGKVKLSKSSPQGRSVIVQVASSGEILGLSAVISNIPHEVSAETLDSCQVNFMPRVDFLRFLERHGEVSLRVGQHLSQELRRAYRQVARIALAPTAGAKLAGLLLEWANRESLPAPEGLHFTLHLTHEQIAEVIGISRETVTRLINDFRHKGLIRTNGSMVILPDPQKLENFIT